MIPDHLQKCGIFSYFQYGFRSSRSTADLLTVISDRIARVFNGLGFLMVLLMVLLMGLLTLLRVFNGATRAVALDMPKAFDRVWHAGLLHKIRSYGISGQILGLISSFLNNRRLRVVLDGKSLQEHPVNGGVPQRSILGPTLPIIH